MTGEVGGTVPPTLALTLGAPAKLRRLHAGGGAHLRGVDHGHGDSQRGRRRADRRRPDGSTNGAFTLTAPLEGLGTVKTWTGPISNDVVAVPFKQKIAATEPLRTGSYSATLTFTLSTTGP